MEQSVNRSFELISEKELEEFAAMILPAGYVADFLLYSEKAKEISPAALFLKKVMENKDIVKGFICHSLWIAGPIKKSFEGRKVTCHNNIISHVENAGMEYIDIDINVDNDLITARTGGHFSQLAKAIIDKIKSKDESISENIIVKRADIRKQKISQGILMQNLGKGQLLNALHWNMKDESVVYGHKHSSEQFGYVIKGGFKILFNEEEYEIHEGDCYFVPPNVLHKFIALGETEAIDVFNPIKVDIPKEIE